MNDGREPKQAVALIAASDVERDPRVRRQIDALAPFFNITVFGFGRPHRGDVASRLLIDRRGSLLRKLQFKAFSLIGIPSVSARHLPLSPASESVRVKRFDAVIANDPETLPLASELANRNQAGFVFDAHEYSPGQFTGDLLWELTNKRVWLHLLEKYVPTVDRMVTVNQAIADAYQRDYGIQPTVITNAGAFHAHEPTPVAAQHLRLVYHGGVNPSRQIDRMLDAFLQLDKRFTLDLMIANTRTKYAKQIMRRVHAMDRVSIVEPVPFEAIVPFTNNYDVGIYLLPPTNFNTANALPNKFFEYLQARLAIAIGPTPTMAAMVKEYGCGVIAKDFSAASFASALNDLTAAKTRSLKHATNRAAHRLNAEQNAVLWRNVVSSAIRQARSVHG